MISPPSKYQSIHTCEVLDDHPYYDNAGTQGVGTNVLPYESSTSVISHKGLYLSLDNFLTVRNIWAQKRCPTQLFTRERLYGWVGLVNGYYQDVQLLAF